MNSTEHRFTTWDGTELFYRAWLPPQQARRALLLFHRGHEHSARWEETVRALALDDVAVFAWDQRGHGQSPGPRGHAPNLAAVIRDADCFARHVAETHGIASEDTIVLAHSVGAVVATAWVHDYAPRLRALILGTPAFRVRLYVPFAIPALRLKEKLFGPGEVKSYVKAKMLTHDPEQAAAYAADPQIFRQIAVNVLLDLFDTSQRLVADAGAIVVPTLVISAGADWVVNNATQRLFFERLSSPVKRFEELPGFHHAIFHEKERARLFQLVGDFIRERFTAPAPQRSLVQADEQGYTRQEYDRLQQPGSPAFGLVRASMKTLGQLSEGIQLGWKAGFDAGVTLDYVYENRARGRTPLGRMIDRNYLDSIGWRGIRQRRVHLQQLLAQALRQIAAAGRPVRLVDIACGGGRYVLETMAAERATQPTALLRDYKPENLEVARGHAQRLGLNEATTFAQADAFDRAGLAALTPRPTIAIVSGLYELFPQNAAVRTSLAGLAEALEPGGLLLYTNQPWHPQVEFIARVLTNREGQPWIMRRRTQAEMDDLVAEAGFAKEAQLIDEWGIFTVSLARRVQA
ncbi:MAG: bifunctional alpha/beta hydrolase/class I SAM-dependent methyltransferase [Verrucomicrobia bacterium]|nr:bifunctional alpha/beta hydrolase/class I SAM-dependent methyltransferase [Verrucomicrobiota bacterium]